MKSRQKFTVSNRNIQEAGKDPDRRSLELRARNRVSSNPLIQKNIGFLQTYNNLFKKPVNLLGDADSFFRKSLRNYSDSLDIIRELRLEKKISNHKKNSSSSAKQRSIYTKHHHPCGDHSKLYPASKQLTAQESFEAGFRSIEPCEGSVQELFSKSPAEEQFQSASEDEDRDFFSPLGATNTQISLTDKSGFDLKEQKFEDPVGVEDIKMAEDMDGEDLNEDINETEDEEEVDDATLKDIEQMIQQASDELQSVAEENKQMMDTLEENDEEELGVTDPTAKPDDKKDEDQQKKEQGKDPGGDGSYFKFDPAIDAAVLKELEEAEKQAKATANVIADLKDRVAELLKKEKMSEAEGKELEQKNMELRKQMILFEEKTKRIQALLGQANLFEKMQAIQPPLQTKHAEDILPKMLVCGRDDFIPKIVLCHERKDRHCRSRSSSQQRTPSPTTCKLRESYNMQEKLVADNVDLEGTRYKLQTDLIDKDRTVECLQKQLCSLQNELRMAYQEHGPVNDPQQQGMACPIPGCPKNRSRSNSPTRSGGPCGPGKGPCPGAVESRLQEYSQTTSQLEKQLIDVEEEVRAIQQELIEVQKEREHLEHHRRMLAVCPPPCPPYPCNPPPCGPPPPCGYPPCPRPPPPCFPADGAGDDQQYKEMKEKYQRLQEDFKAKLTEVAGLRADNEKLKEMAEKAEETRAKLELKVKDLEKRLKELRGDGDKGSSKEQLVDLQQQIKVHKELYRQAQDELEELRALVEDLQGQLSDYRNKYLQAIQTVEEQNRQIDIMRLESNRVSEQVNLEIIRVKNQFQEKLQELAPLPDVLKATQLKLQEAQQMHLLAERNNEAQSRELQTYKDKLQAIMDDMALANSDKQNGAGEKESLMAQVKRLEEELQQSKDENDELKIDLDRQKEVADENERLASSRQHEIVQLETQLETVREESARQVARIKDRCEIVRKSMQNQISDMERQLARAAAMAKAAERDRDDVRQKMQAQIRNLNENFEDAQMRIRNLQGHVNFLKNSYCPPCESAVLTDKSAPKVDPCCCAGNY
ncbi:myosin-11 [Sitophilus oryzae]|uniref:Myosin-11 n=1 Tax=Sitophilus oryzae TaxID=7048 RepID=A0A6J2YRS3_SITOR|nr:myosin-11 [Sitophilus oryzae]